MTAHHLASAVIRGRAAWIPYRIRGERVEVYTVGVLDETGGNALLTVIAGGGPIGDREAFLERLEDACVDDECMGHAVVRLTDEERVSLEAALTARWQHRGDRLN